MSSYFNPVPKSYRQPGKRKGLNARNPSRADAKFADAFNSPEYVQWIRDMGCAVLNCRKQDIECAHAGPLRVKGGKWWEIVPLCSAHHREQEGQTERFNKKYGLDLIDIAAVLALKWKERTKSLPNNSDLYPVEPLSDRTDEGNG